MYDKFGLCCSIDADLFLRQGVEYMSDGDKEAEDAEHVEDTDVLAQQRHVSSRVGARMMCARMKKMKAGTNVKACIYMAP
jgi:hypothetical protein